MLDIFSYLYTEDSKINTTTRKIKFKEMLSVYFVERRLVNITNLHGLFYKNKVKIIPLNIAADLLTPISLVYLVLDDGNNRQNGFILNSHGFTVIFNYYKLLCILIEV